MLFKNTETKIESERLRFRYYAKQIIPHTVALLRNLHHTSFFPPIYIWLKFFSFCRKNESESTPSLVNKQSARKKEDWKITEKKKKFI